MSTVGDPPDWNNFHLAQSIAVPFSRHAVPTNLYRQHQKEHNEALTMAFTDPEEIFTKSRSIASSILSSNPDDTTDLAEAYEKSLQSIFSPNLDDEATTILDKETATQVVIHALRLANTEPTIFGLCCELKQEEKEAVFNFLPFVSGSLDPAIGAERHDIVQWIACFNIFGKAFSLDTWVSAFAVSLQPPHDPSQDVIRVTCGPETFTVSRDAKEAMDIAINHLSTRPTYYWKMSHLMRAVTKILGKDTNEYSMPHTTQQLADFKWDDVVPGRDKMYPKALDPDAEDYEKVRTIHEVIKKERDAIAHRQGDKSSTVPAYNTLRQCWNRWRKIHALYRHMYKDETLQMVADRVTGRLKFAPSYDAMTALMAQDVEQHQKKLRREAYKRKAADALKEQIALAEETARLETEKAARFEQEKVQLETAVEQLQQEEEVEYPPATRRTTRRATTNNNTQQRKEDEIKRKRLQASRKDKAIAQAMKKADEKTKEKEELTAKRAIAEADTTPEKKKSRRKDVQNLVRIVTPRKRMSLDGQSWSPPMRKEGSLVAYSPPGNKWKEESIRKLTLLTMWRHHLRASHLIPVAMSFPSLMEFIETEEDLDFNSRIFLYLMALLLVQKRYDIALCLPPVPYLQRSLHPSDILPSCFNDVHAILLSFVAEGLTSSAKVVTREQDEQPNRFLQGLISEHDDKNLIAGTIIDLCKELENQYHGQIPQTKAELLGLHLDDSVACLLMQHVFGSRELVVGLHARKILTALDMLDWEETGKIKSAVKMAQVKADHVRKSLKTWLPKGQALEFHDTMDSIGTAIRNQRIGDWGRIKGVIKANFNAKDKAQLEEMADTISQLYTATTGGGQRRISCD